MQNEALQLRGKRREKKFSMVSKKRQTRLRSANKFSCFFIYFLFSCPWQFVITSRENFEKITTHSKNEKNLEQK